MSRRPQEPKPISDHTENSSRQHTKTLPHSSNEVRMNGGAMGVTRQKTEGGKESTASPSRDIFRAAGRNECEG